MREIFDGRCQTDLQGDAFDVIDMPVEFSDNPLAGDLYIFGNGHGQQPEHTAFIQRPHHVRISRESGQALKHGLIHIILVDGAGRRLGPGNGANNREKHHRKGRPVTHGTLNFFFHEEQNARSIEGPAGDVFLFFLLLPGHTSLDDFLINFFKVRLVNPTFTQ